MSLSDATADIRIVRLAIVAGGAFRFAAGQYARVTFSGQRPRDFSMANRPGTAELEFHIRHRSDGGASAYAARTLRIGDGVWVEGPLGDAWLRSDGDRPIVCLAGGSGLGPMKSIVEMALQRDPKRCIDLYFGGRDEGDVYLEAHFRALEARHQNFRYHILLSEPGGMTLRRRGTVVDGLLADGAAHAIRVGRWANATCYAAGPPAMIRAAREAMLALGFAVADIHADGFQSVPAPTGGVHA